MIAWSAENSDVLLERVCLCAVVDSVSFVPIDPSLNVWFNNSVGYAVKSASNEFNGIVLYVLVR